MNADVLLFFDRHREALPIYRAFEGRVLGEIEEARLKVQKTQITFLNRRVFAAVSFLPVRRAGDRPETWLTVTFGLSRPPASTRPWSPTPTGGPTTCSSPGRRRLTAS